MTIDMTRLSERGQVVIPNELRKQMGLKEGARFIVLGIDDTIVLRKLELSKERIKLRQILEKSKKKAGKIGFTEIEIDKLIQSVRKVSK